MSTTLLQLKCRPFQKYTQVGSLFIDSSSCADAILVSVNRKMLELLSPETVDKLVASDLCKVLDMYPHQLIVLVGWNLTINYAPYLITFVNNNCDRFAFSECPKYDCQNFMEARQSTP